MWFEALALIPAGMSLVGRGWLSMSLKDCVVVKRKIK